MNEWALLKAGKIINIIMTSRVKSEVERMYPGYQVADVYGLPPHVRQAYGYWNERP
jgi:hypothetical protein